MPTAAAAAPRIGAVLRITFFFLVDIPYFLLFYTPVRMIEPEKVPRESTAQPRRTPAGMRPRRQRVVLVRRRGCRRLPCPETGQDRGSAKELARTMPGRPRPICRAQDA